jgi:hypothetical protein
LPNQPDHFDSPSSDQPKTLTALEVNPLVNPLLAENMGRWAEVYFKSPPENREQAVRELLQQLEAENSQRGNAPGSPRWTNEQGLTHDENSRSEAFVPSLENHPPQTAHSFSDESNEQSRRHSLGEHAFDEHSLVEPAFAEPTVAEPDFAEPDFAKHVFAEHAFGEESEKSRAASPQPTILCLSCGHENRAGQRFCGMCGLPLQREIAADRIEEEIEANRLIERNSPPSRHGEKFKRALSATPKFWDGQESGSDDSVSAGLIRSLDYGTGTRSYSVYTGAVIVVVVLALGYVGWRSSRATGYSSYATQAAPAAAGQPMPQTPQPIPPAVDAVEQSANEGPGTAAASQSKPVAKPNIATQNNERPSVERVSATGSATKPSVTATSPAAEPQVPATGGSGYEELAMAKRYLNGSAGQQNSAEAVEWLWKAVAKRNTDATLLLSEMFMRGEGIPKNCDQARILLDAAASRGVKDAAIRLRNMQAFGCQ